MTAVVLRGDAAHLPMPDESVDLIVCSPPYYGLRSYTDGGEHYEGQIGAEETPREYIANLLRCTAEWVRVLKPGGSIFVNCGDKYNSAASGHKSLLGLPWRYALGCIDDLGLILRRDIIWHKVNGLPESVTDRCRTSHEYLFHLVKQPRYYAAVDEVREPVQADQHSMSRRGRTDRRLAAADGGQTSAANPLGKLPGSVWEIADDETPAVWKIASQPLVVPEYLGIQHFAAFPVSLVKPVILGWSPPGICLECGEGRRPVADVTRRVDGGTERPAADLRRGNARQRGQGATSTLGRTPTATITGYACACPQPYAPTRPAIVVDPFSGTGTTAMVASVLGRIGIGVDRSADYCRLARWRTTDPAERARALGVPKPPPVPDGQASLFDSVAGEATALPP